MVGPRAGGPRERVAHLPIAHHPVGCGVGVRGEGRRGGRGEETRVSCCPPVSCSGEGPFSSLPAPQGGRPTTHNFMTSISRRLEGDAILVGGRVEASPLVALTTKREREENSRPVSLLLFSAFSKGAKASRVRGATGCRHVLAGTWGRFRRARGKFWGQKPEERRGGPSVCLSCSVGDVCDGRWTFKLELGYRWMRARLIMGARRCSRPRNLFAASASGVDVGVGVGRGNRQQVSRCGRRNKRRASVSLH